MGLFILSALYWFSVLVRICFTMYTISYGFALASTHRLVVI